MYKYRKILRYAGGQRRFFALILVLTICASFLAALQPWPMKILVDQVLGQKPPPAMLQSALAVFAIKPSTGFLLAFAALGGLLLFAASSALEISLTWAWTLAGRRMVYELAENLFARLQRRSLPFHSRTSVGDTMGRVTVDSWCAYQVVDALCFGPFHALLTMAGMGCLMARLDGSMALLAFMVAPLIIGASFLLGKPLRAAAKLKREIESSIQSQIQQTLTGIPVVQAFAQEDREHRRFAQLADAAVRVQQRSTLIGSVNSLASGLATTLGAGLVLWVGARHVIVGELTIGGLLVFLVYLTSLQTQVKTLANVYPALQGFNGAVERVMQVLDAEPEVADKPGALALPCVRGHIKLEKVVFSYKPDHPVLREVSLEIQSGECVAIVGQSGAGKSTLAGLVPRFFDPTDGRVLIDGKDARDVRLEDLRRQVALVLQEPFLFPSSVSENIAYGKPDATGKEIEAAARTANAHEFIKDLPHGYETIIGERGATLSGGERQRLAIARALLKNAPILVLDEPTSALDSKTEKSIFEALERLMTGRTVLIIAHRLSTVRRADRIVVLGDGEVVETGTPQQLLASDGAYARLHHLQFADEPQPLAI